MSSFNRCSPSSFHRLGDWSATRAAPKQRRGPGRRSSGTRPWPPGLGPGLMRSDGLGESSDVMMIYSIHIYTYTYMYIYIYTIHINIYIYIIWNIIDKVWWSHGIVYLKPLFISERGEDKWNGDWSASFGEERVTETNANSYFFV